MVFVCMSGGTNAKGAPFSEGALTNTPGLFTKEDRTDRFRLSRLGGIGTDLSA